jgi:hypothetical protein
MPPAAEPDKKLKPWMVLGSFGLGGLGLAAIALWLLWGGTATVMSWLPDGVVKAVGEKAGEGKVIERQKDPEGAPWEMKAYKTHAGKDDPEAEEAQEAAAPTATGKSDDAVKAEATLAPIKAAAEAADQALDALAADPKDQKAYLTAVHAIETLKSAQVLGGNAALRQAAVERRGELVAEKQASLDALQTKGRTTHVVKSATTLHKAADDGSEALGALAEGTQVHVFLDTGSGWSRVEALTGEAIGKNGYVPSKALSRSGKK